MIQESQMRATQEQKQKVTVTGGGLGGNWLNTLFMWGAITLAILAFIAYCLWQYGGLPGKFIDIAVVIVAVGSGLWFLYTWACNRYYHTIRLATNSKVIETQHASVWWDGPDNYVNFTAEIAREVNITSPPEREVEPYTPPTFEENYAKSVYSAKEDDRLTWDEIAEKFHTSVGVVRGKHKEYIKMLESGRVI
jgi:hypothetical protein